jgi:hypothetical protein
MAKSPLRSWYTRSLIPLDCKSKQEHETIMKKDDNIAFDRLSSPKSEICIQSSTSTHLS